MTERTVANHTMPPAVEHFVLQWGDMGSQWGVNRSVAQIHALLYLAERPLTAENIAETLGIARSNVSTSLRELQAWKLVRRVPVLGDRRDHFEAETDLWEMATRIARGRKEREIDPAAAVLKACRDEADGDARVSAVVRKRLAEMDEFISTLLRWHDQMLAVPAPKLMALVRMGSKVASLVGFGRGKKAKEAEVA